MNIYQTQFLNSLISLVTLFLIACGGGGNSELPSNPPDNSSPNIVETSPGSKDNFVFDVAVTASITIKFDEDIQEPDKSNIILYKLDVNEARIEPPINGKIDYSSMTKTVKFKGPFKTKATRYEVLVVNIKDKSNNLILAPYSWKFETTINPTVVSTLPANNTVANSPNPNIEVSFSEAILLDSLYFNTSPNFLIKNTLNSSDIITIKAATLVQGDTKTIKITSDIPLTPENNYEITIIGGGNGVTDLASNPFIGNNGPNYSWLFQTPAVDITKPRIKSSFPKDTASALNNTEIRIEFDESMDEASLIGSFSLYDESLLNSGTTVDLIPDNYSFTYDPNTYIVTYTLTGAKLTNLVTYRAVQRLTATDINGNTLEANVANTTENITRFTVKSALWTTASIVTSQSNISGLSFVPGLNGKMSAIIGIRSAPVNTGSLIHNIYNDATNTWTSSSSLASKSKTTDSNSLSYRQEPYAVSNSNGDIFISWIWDKPTLKTYVTRFGDTTLGNDWSDPKAISTNTLTGASNIPWTDIAVSDNGDAMAVWVEEFPTTPTLRSIQFSKYTKNTTGVDGSWSAASDVIASTSSYIAKVALDGSGNGFVAYTEGTVIKVIKQTAGIWNTAQIRSIASGHNGWELELEMDNAGNAIVVWDQRGRLPNATTATNNIHTKYYTAATASWDINPTIIGSSGTYNNSFLNVRMNKQAGYAVLTYVLRYPVGDPKGNTTFVSYFDKTSWSAPEIIGNSSIWVTSNVDVFSDGRAIAVMTQNINSGGAEPHVIAKEYTPGVPTGSWSIAQPVINSTARTRGVYVRYNSDGLPTVAWFGESSTSNIMELLSSSLR